jgi:osmotically-inducible protein OsmY
MGFSQQELELEAKTPLKDSYDLLISVDRSAAIEKEGKIDNLISEEDIYLALRMNSKTSHLNNIKVYVKQGVVTLLGQTSCEDDIVQVYDLVRDLDGIVTFKMSFNLRKSRHVDFD